MRPLVRLGLVVLVVGGAFAGWRWIGRGPAPRAGAGEPRPSEAAIDPVVEQRAILAGEVRRLSLEVAELKAEKASTIATAGGGGAEPAAKLPPPRPATPEVTAKWLMARAAFLDGVLAGQPRDDRWADPIEARLRATYTARADEGVQLVSARCRATACRLEFTYKDAEARTRAIERLGVDLPELPRVTYAYPGEPESHTRAIMYVAADEHPLPPLDYEQYAAANPG